MARGEVNVVNEKSLADYDFAPFSGEMTSRPLPRPSRRSCNGGCSRPDLAFSSADSACYSCAASRDIARDQI
jgi:hypothetical protein